MPPKPTPKGCSNTPVVRKTPPVIQESECSKVITVPQLSGVCWFTALIMSIYFSQYSRAILLNKMSQESKGMPIELKALLWDMMQRRYKSVYEMKDYAYLFFKLITPEAILKRLHEYNPSEFNFDPEKRSGYLNYLYLPKLLKFMGASDLLILDLDEKTKNLTYSVMNNGLRLETKKDNHNAYTTVVRLSDVKYDEKDEYDYVLIYVNDLLKGKDMFKKKFVMDDTFTHKRKTYVLDSVLMSNFNYDSCKMGHDICGITCGDERYMYNGWIRSTIDKSMTATSVRVLPCELMKYDWTNKRGGDFCINSSMCSMDLALDKETLKKKVCFNFHKGDRVYIYVNKKRSMRPATPKSPKTPDDFSYDEILDILKKKNENKNKTTKGPKECPPGKVLNPATNRCVKEKGPKECPPGKVLNPKTNRCVKEKVLKDCPPGKERNPETNKCVKIKEVKPEKKKVVHKKKISS